MKGSHIHPPPNPQEQGPENTPRNPPRESSENHHQEVTGTIQPSPEEPLLTDKTHIHLRSASIWTYTFFTMGIP
jgi:hypothetical protein